jgi:hypothetical protein
VTCPFVTAVGATQIDPGKTVDDPEGACEQVIFSGGGFSNIFAMPAYQQDAVTSFLTNHPPPFTAAQFNNSGKVRGILGVCVIYVLSWLGPSVPGFERQWVSFPVALSSYSSVEFCSTVQIT